MVPLIMVLFIPLYIAALCIIFPLWRRCDPTLCIRIPSMMEYAALSGFVAVVTAAFVTSIFEVIIE